jgi:hypothetical protein
LKEGRSKLDLEQLRKFGEDILAINRLLEQKNMSLLSLSLRDFYWLESERCLKLGSFGLSS